jgi:hypothetical protein
LYSGSIVLHGFSNDTTDGTTEPFTTNVPVVVFHGLHCRTGAFHAKSTLTLPTYYNTNTTASPNGNYNVFTIPNYGGQVATLHTSHSTFVVPGCTGTTASLGHPIDGSGTMQTTGTYSTSRSVSNPRGFTIPASDLARISTGGSFNYYFPYIFEIHYGDLRNVKGTFAAGNGAAKLAAIYSNVFTYLNSPAVGGVGSIRVKAGAKKFGGTMRLLGTFYSHEGFKSVYDTYVARYTWLFDMAGAQGQGSQTPAITVDSNFYIGRTAGFANTTTVAAYAFSWTTGTVTVTAIGGPFGSIMTRKGYDFRSPHGGGEIQMVSPALTRWIFGDGALAYQTAMVGILQVSVAPEPHEWMLLGAGLSMLGLLYRANRRSR